MSKTDCWIWALLFYMVTNNITQGGINNIFDLIWIITCWTLYIVYVFLFLFKK